MLAKFGVYESIISFFYTYRSKSCPVTQAKGQHKNTPNFKQESFNKSLAESSQEINQIKTLFVQQGNTPRKLFQMDKVKFTIKSVKIIHVHTNN